MADKQKVIFLRGSKEDYDSLSVKDPNTIYFIIGDEDLNEIYLGDELFSSMKFSDLKETNNVALKNPDIQEILNKLSKDKIKELINLSDYIKTNEADNKYQQKENNKGLSSNDFTTTLKNKLESLSNYNDEEIRNEISLKQDILSEEDKKEIAGLADVPVKAISVNGKPQIPNSDGQVSLTVGNQLTPGEGIDITKDVISIDSETIPSKTDFKTINDESIIGKGNIDIKSESYLIPIGVDENGYYELPIPERPNESYHNTYITTEDGKFSVGDFDLSLSKGAIITGGYQFNLGDFYSIIDNNDISIIDTVINKLYSLKDTIHISEDVYIENLPVLYQFVETLATKTELAELNRFIVVSELPVEEPNPSAVYLVPKDESDSLNNVYDEYIWVAAVGEAPAHWEYLGNTDINLDGYATEEWVNEKVDFLNKDGDGTKYLADDGSYKTIEVSGFKKVIVDNLPTENIDEECIYLALPSVLETINLPSMQDLYVNNLQGGLIYNNGEYYYAKSSTVNGTNGTFFIDENGILKITGGWYTYLTVYKYNKTSNSWDKVTGTEQMGGTLTICTVGSNKPNFLFVSADQVNVKDFNKKEILYSYYREDNVYNIQGEYIGQNKVYDNYVECVYQNGKWEMLGREPITKISQLENDSNFISSLKTINNETLIGEGNVEINVDCTKIVTDISQITDDTEILITNETNVLTIDNEINENSNGLASSRAVYQLLTQQLGGSIQDIYNLIGEVSDNE